MPNLRELEKLKWDRVKTLIREGRFPMKPDLALAIEHKEELEKKGNWTLLTTDFTNGKRKVTLEYGTIHSNGQREVKIATREYYLYKDGEEGPEYPRYSTQIHV